MYFSVLTVTSTAVIGTITASPLRQPGPSDTAIFSVVSPSPAETTPEIRTVTETATVTENRSPYPAFNASSYPHHNFTGQHDHHGKDCASALPVIYTNGDERFNVTVFPSGIAADCRHHHPGKNETKHPHGSQGLQPTRPTTSSVKSEQPYQVGESDSHGVPYVGAGGKIHESDSSTDGPLKKTSNRTKNNESAQAGVNVDPVSKRRNAIDLNNEAIPAHVNGLKASAGSQKLGSESLEKTTE